MKVHKKVLALSVSIMVFSASLCFGVLLIDNTNYEKASVVINKIENNYKIYIKGDSVMRISLKEKFHSCTTGEKVKTCGLIRNTVIKVVDLNTNEEKEEYANKDIIEVINMQYDGSQLDTVNPLVYQIVKMDETQLSKFIIGIESSCSNKDEKNIEEYQKLEQTISKRENKKEAILEYIKAGTTSISFATSLLTLAKTILGLVM